MNGQEQLVMKVFTIKNKIACTLRASVLLAFAAAFLCLPVCAQATDDYQLPQGFTFYSKVWTDTVEVLGRFYDNDSLDYVVRQNYNAEFAGIREKVGVLYSSEKFDMELAPEFALSDSGEHWNVYDARWTNSAHALNADDLSFSWTGLDWHVRFTPFDIVDFNMHSNVRTPGGYLPVADQWLSAADLQGDGVGVVFKPVSGLRLALEVPFGFGIFSVPNMLNAEFEDTGGTGKITWKSPEKKSDYRFVINAGADYRILDFITVGAAVHNILNRDLRAYGLYAGADLGMFTFGGGYTYNGEATRISYIDFDGTGAERVFIGGHHRANAYVTATAGDFSAALEALVNFVKTQSIYDFYAGLRLGYDLLPGRFNTSVLTGVALDFGNMKSGGIGYTRYREQGQEDKVMYAGGTYYFYTKKGSGARHSTQRKAEVASPMVELQPCITYITGRNTFCIRTALQFWLDGEGSYAATVPLSWKYIF